MKSKMCWWKKVLLTMAILILLFIMIVIILFWRVIRTAASVDESVELLSQYDLHASAGMMVHFAIADAAGCSAVVEYIDNEMNVVETDIATNFNSPFASTEWSIVYNQQTGEILYYHRENYNTGSSFRLDKK